MAISPKWSDSGIEHKIVYLLIWHLKYTSTKENGYITQNTLKNSCPYNLNSR